MSKVWFVLDVVDDVLDGSAQIRILLWFGQRLPTPVFPSVYLTWRRGLLKQSMNLAGSSKNHPIMTEVRRTSDDRVLLLVPSQRPKARGLVGLRAWLHR
ncbi:hypothetical protein D8674_021847 [Pyrus ussuriensis x Pyrus communis]|uniref:Uncharacterized protein n=1 Tax=Pyrus ussuriensis x Pyrus communis TaxID=2448454 RepID=A0A5N5GIA4_9ROSA|nr:hypothetical protein D8674_021847 [Pyrus ussuriensis x Pyrus communis]